MSGPQNPAGSGEAHSEDLSGRLLGRFRIESRLGAGAMGEVYVAEDTRLKRRVALKRIAPKWRADPRLASRFHREVELASRLSHPHIAAVYDVFEEDGETFLVMEYVEGETLRLRLRQAPFSPDEFLPIASQCASALAAAHEGGVLHRDLKPENILLTRDGQVKILDFGLAMDLPRSSESTLSDSEPGMKGTPAYMSPEALQEKKVDARADLFSLGVVFYEMLAGRHPFLRPEESFLATANRITGQEEIPLYSVNPKIPLSLSAIDARLLAKQPDERYQTARELAADLKAAASGGVPSAAVPRPSRSTPSLVRRLGGLSALLVLAGAAGLYIHRSTARRGHPSPGPAPVSRAQAVRSIAILPFRNLGGPGSYDYFGAGLADVLTARLTNARFLEVHWAGPGTDLTSSAPSPIEVGQRLGVDAVLSGSYQIEGATLGLSYTLVDVRRRVEIAGNALAIPFTRSIDAEQQLTGQIVNSLESAASPEERAQLTAAPSGQSEAFQAYLRSDYGMDRFWNKPAESQLTLAEKQLERALQLDPAFTLARVSLAKVNWIAAFNDYGNAGAHLRDAEAQAQLAIRQDPTLGEASAVLALVEFQEGRLDEARASLRESFARSPHAALAYYAAGIYYLPGIPELSEQAFLRARALDPELVRRELGYAYRYEGNLGKAEDQMRLDLAQHPGDAVTEQSLATVLLDRGDIAGARRLIAPLRRNLPGSPEVQYLVALLAVRAGLPFRLRDWLDGYRAEYWADGGSCVNVAEVLAFARENAEAVCWLRRSAELGLRDYPFLEKDPALDNLRGDPAFHGFLESVRQQWQQMRQREEQDPLMPPAPS